VGCYPDRICALGLGDDGTHTAIHLFKSLCLVPDGFRQRSRRYRDNAMKTPGKANLRARVAVVLPVAARYRSSHLNKIISSLPLLLLLSQK
jgi:hypothetical protein